MKPTLAQVRLEAAAHLEAIHRLFTPDSKILVVVAFPDTPDQNWMLGNATIEEAVAGLRWLESHGEEHPPVTLTEIILNAEGHPHA